MRLDLKLRLHIEQAWSCFHFRNILNWLILFIEFNEELMKRKFWKTFLTNIQRNVGHLNFSDLSMTNEIEVHINILR